MIDAVSYELLETIQQEKTNTVGAFSWLIKQTFHQISACSQNYFHWHSKTLFVFLFFQDEAKWNGWFTSFYSPLVHKNTELCYLWVGSDLGLNPWNCMALCVHTSRPLSLQSHLSFGCFIFTHSKHVSLIDDNSRAEKWGEVLFTA